MKPRITINARTDGEFELWLNKEGRDLLVRELLNLDEGRDHFHMADAGMRAGCEIELSPRPYREATNYFRPGRRCFVLTNGIAPTFRMS